MDEATVSAASRGEQEAVVAVLTAVLPEVWRMSVNLSGGESAGREIARDVLRRGQVAMEGFERPEQAKRWFRHHTILAVRTAKATKEADALLNERDVPPALRAAFRAHVAALRKLPEQQREAFLLRHGEGWDDRQLGIAMDCSVEAASVHFRRANESLAPLAPDLWPQLVRVVGEAYRANDPPADVRVPLVRRWMSGRLRRRLTAAALFLGWAIVLAVAACLAILAWWLWPRLDW